MAQSTAVVRGTLPATASGTTDFTSSGFGTVSAALIIVCNANTTNNPQANSVLSLGFWDGTDQRVVAIVGNDGEGTSNTARGSNDAYAVNIPDAASSSESSYTCSAVTDGIRLTLSIDNTGVERYCTVLLIGGVSAKVLTFTPNATQNATQASASIGFAPTAAFFTCIGDTVADRNGVAQALLSLGFAESGGTHRMIAFLETDAQATTDNNLLYSETRCVGQIFGGAVTWTGEVTTWGADTFTMTTRDGASGSDVCFALVLGGDVSLTAGTLTTPVSTGNDDVTTTGIDPGAVLAVLSTASSTTIETGNGAEGISVGLTDGTNSYSHSIVSEDNAGTSSDDSYATASQVIDLMDVAGGSVAALADATATVGTEKFTLNYSAVPGTARKGFYVAFGPATATGFQTAWASHANGII